MRDRFDTDLLDDGDPFEIDSGNLPHLYKHLPTVGGRYIAVGVEDLEDVYFGIPVFYPGTPEGPADWLMIGEVPGLTLLIPLAPPNSGNPAQCRPIGIYQPSQAQVQQYRADTR